ncbi:MAG: hypothetical protein R3182_04225, partial [Draconibacterium sp.]|nr:hypothetical protein [Draconibacterium sp.]
IIEANPLGQKLFLEQVQINDLAKISLMGAKPDQHNTVIKVRLEGIPEVAPTIISVQPGENILLDNMMVSTSGNTKKRYNRRGKLFISKWNSPADKASWLIDIKQSGKYRLEITYSAPHKSVGSEYNILIDKKTVSAKIEETGIDFDYKTFSLGEISIDNPGVIKVELNPAENLESDLMYFKSLELTPVEI